MHFYGFAILGGSMETRWYQQGGSIVTRCLGSHMGAAGEVAWRRGGSMETGLYGFVRVLTGFHGFPCVSAGFYSF